MSPVCEPERGVSLRGPLLAVGGLLAAAVAWSVLSAATGFLLGATIAVNAAWVLAIPVLVRVIRGPRGRRVKVVARVPARQSLPALPLAPVDHRVAAVRMLAEASGARVYVVTPAQVLGAGEHGKVKR